MNNPADNLSGFWVGRYAYDGGFGKPVSFLANVKDDGGALSGTISEPNQMGVSSDELHAIISGSREGSDIFFVKAYDGASDAAHRVDYAGMVNAQGTEISGHWILSGTSGTFTMTREIVVEAEETVAESEALLINLVDEE